MEIYRIHPIVMGTKVFDKSMMTYQYGQGQFRDLTEETHRKCSGLFG